MQLLRTVRTFQTTRYHDTMAWLATSLHRRVVSSAHLFSIRLSSAQLGSAQLGSAQLSSVQLSSAQLCSAQLLTTYQLLPTYHLSSQPKTRNKQKGVEGGKIFKSPGSSAVVRGFCALALPGALGRLASLFVIRPASPCTSMRACGRIAWPPMTLSLIWLPPAGRRCQLPIFHSW